MNRLTFIFLLATALPVFAASDWISLFNGTDSTGWKVGGDQNTFQVKDGALVANGQVATRSTMGRSTTTTSKTSNSW